MILLLPTLLVGQDDFIADVDSAFAQGNAYMAKFQYAKAIPHFYNCVRSERSNIYLNRLAYAYQQMGNYRDAKIYYNTAFKNDSTDVTPLIQLGSIAEKESNLSQAASYYDRLIDADSTVAHYYKLKAKVSLKQGEDLKALYAYTYALHLTPTDIETIGEMAKIYLKLKDVQSAAELVTQGFHMDSSNKTMRYLRTNIAFKLKEYEEVVQVMTSLLSEGDTVLHYQRLLAMAYLELEAYEDARVQLLSVISNEKPNELTYYRLAQAYDGLDSIPESLAAYEKAIEVGISNNVGAYHKNMGIHYEKQNELKKAMKAYRDAFYFDNRPSDLFNLARCQDQYYADKKIALRTYQRFLKMEMDQEKEKLLIEYADSRVSALKTEIFQRGS